MILALLLAATTPNPKLPQWEAKPPPGTIEAQIMAPVTAMLAGIAARDGAAILAQAKAEGGLTAAIENADGSRTIRYRSWADYAAALKAGAEAYEERLTDPAIEIDGDIAMVWSPYLFLIDGRVHHCGVDHFDVVRDNGAWKVLSITWSQRTDCGAING